jgi:HEAT repeat protein
MRYLPLLVLALLLSGCGRSPPTTVHGKSVSHWVASLGDRDVKLRRKAVRVLGNVGPGDPAVLPALTQAVGDRDASVRSEAIEAILKIGPDAREAIPALEARRQDSNVRVRALAVKALERIR